VAPSDVAWFVHQANIGSSVGCQPAGHRRRRTVVNIDRYGNTSAARSASLAEAADDGRLQDGDLVLMSGFGSGMTWASALLRWGKA
jgi:3-oxoacyl-[acyl-carrier-protein] synthase-3